MKSKQRRSLDLRLHTSGKSCIFRCAEWTVLHEYSFLFFSWFSAHTQACLHLEWMGYFCERLYSSEGIFENHELWILCSLQMKLAEQLDGYIFKQATNFVDMTSEHKTFKRGDSLWLDRMTGRTHERREIYRSVRGTAEVQLKVFLAVLKCAVCYHLFALLTFSHFAPPLMSC